MRPADCELRGMMNWPTDSRANDRIEIRLCCLSIQASFGMIAAFRTILTSFFVHYLVATEVLSSAQQSIALYLRLLGIPTMTAPLPSTNSRLAHEPHLHICHRFPVISYAL
jgi:hypothetical protein